MKLSSKITNMMTESHPEEHYDANDASSVVSGAEENHSIHSASSERHTSGSTNGDAPLDLARRESSAVGSFRLLVILVLVVSTVVVAVLTYEYTRRSEEALFEETFKDDALKILESLGSSLDKAIAGVDAYVISMVSCRATVLALLHSFIQSTHFKP